MNTFDAYHLIERKRWKAFLMGLDPGEHTFLFPSVGDIKSCKAIGYDMNSDGIGRRYYFSVDKSERKITIKVETYDEHETEGRP